MSAETLLVLCSCPDEAVAEKLAKTVIEDGLAACVNIVPGVRSIYKWEGKLEDQREVMLLLKTAETRFDGLQLMIKALHPYELPEIIAVPITRGNNAYLDWIAASTR